MDEDFKPIKLFLVILIAHFLFAFGMSMFSEMSEKARNVYIKDNCNKYESQEYRDKCKYERENSKQ